MWSQVLGLVAALPVLLVIGLSLSWRSVLAGCVAGVGVGISLVLLYSSARFLYIGVSSAVSAVVACVIPVAYSTISHPLSAREGLGVAVCVAALAAVGRWRGDAQVAPGAPGPAPSAVPEVSAVAAAVTSVPPPGRRREVLGIGAALASGVCMSVYYIALAGTSARVQVTEAITSRVTASVFLSVIGLLVARRALAPTRSLLSGALPAGLFGIVGALCYATTVRAGTLGLIVPIVSLSPVVTIVVAWLALNERISRRQTAGLLLAMLGIVIVTA